jgi:hypothetical protein
MCTRTFFESWWRGGRSTPLSLLASAQWCYLKCTLFEIIVLATAMCRMCEPSGNAD